MKIGIVTNLYPPHTRGGAENVIVRTVGQLLAMGHDVFVITGQPRAQGTGITVDQSSTERVYRFFPRNIYFTLNDYKYPAFVRLLWHIIDAFSWSAPANVRQILKQEQPDVVITHNLKGIGLNTPRVIRAEGFSHIHVLHDVQLIYPSGLLMAGHERMPWYASPWYALYRYFCRVRIGDPDIVLSPSEYLKSAYSEAGFFKGTKIRVLRNPPPTHSAPRPLQRRPGPLRLFYVGQLARHKGIEFLLIAFAKLKQDRRLLIVGDGFLRPEVEAAAEADENIRYLGYMPPGELSKFFATVDAVVVPSLCYENSPTVIYEALNAGLPVVASRIGGVGELIQEGVTGYLFTPGDETDFIRAVDELDFHKEQLLADGEKIRASVADFSLDKYADRLIEIAEDIVRKHRAATLASNRDV
jgi:glycosyltransferase involved in cell wall biosynthesis